MIEILFIFGLWILALIILMKQAYSRIDMLKDDLKLAHSKIGILEAQNKKF